MSDPRIRPRLVVSGAAEAIDWYVQAFEGREVARFEGPDGKVVHAEIEAETTGFTLKDEDEVDRAPTSAGGGALLIFEVDDVDGLAERMLAGGATVVFPVEDRDEGRSGRLLDPFGHAWIVTGR
jgi:uncharacterized glyoxalase superfamily protein PhnB